MGENCTITANTHIIHNHEASWVPPLYIRFGKNMTNGNYGQALFDFCTSIYFLGIILIVLLFLFIKHLISQNTSSPLKPWNMTSLHQSF